MIPELKRPWQTFDLDAANPALSQAFTGAFVDNYVHLLEGARRVAQPLAGISDLDGRYALGGEDPMIGKARVCRQANSRQDLLETTCRQVSNCRKVFNQAVNRPCWDACLLLAL